MLIPYLEIMRLARRMFIEQPIYFIQKVRTWHDHDVTLLSSTELHYSYYLAFKHHLSHAKMSTYF